MVKSVSNISFKSAIGAMDKVSKEQLYNPGLYSIQEIMDPTPPPYKEKGGFLGFLGRLVLTAAIVLGVPLLARKKLNMIKDIPLDIKPAKEAKIGEKIKFSIAKFGDWVDKTIYQKIAKAFAKKSEKAENIEPPAPKNEEAPKA